MERLRDQMVRQQIESRGVTDERVLAAMRKVERHKFVPGHQVSSAYEDHPLPIGHGQTISQPYIVALMTELCNLDGSEKVLEIGTGSGYQAAVLSLLAKKVYTIEIVEPLGMNARRLLAELGYRNVEVRVGDGYRGWPDEAPFDVIILTAAPAPDTGRPHGPACRGGHPCRARGRIRPGAGNDSQNTRPVAPENGHLRTFCAHGPWR